MFSSQHGKATQDTSLLSFFSLSLNSPFADKITREALYFINSCTCYSKREHSSNKQTFQKL